MDFVRPLDSEGVLQSVLLSTYGLSLSDPPFFEQDFLPTLLGLGGVRERGYSSPANVERRLGQFYCGLACDAHALAQGGRPSLHVDVIPVGSQLHHAKVVLIHRERLVRLVIASANLTHEGFRRNRETAAVLDFHERSDLPPQILADFAAQWLARLGSGSTTGFRRALLEAVDAAMAWKPAPTGGTSLRTVWGGGEVPLWRQVVEAWPQGEKLKEWQICSPFWPSPGEADTPFDVLRRELNSRGANVDDAALQLFALGDAPGIRGRPRFPFLLVEQLAHRGFNPADATICPVRLDALASEVPEGRAEDQRPLHAKWMLLRGEQTSLLLLGSANFTRRGLGVLKNPAKANIEVCVLIRGSSETLHADNFAPPIAVNGIVKWSDCSAASLAAPLEEVEVEPWPEFISGIELEVRWETQPVSGALQIRCLSAPDFSIAWEKGDAELLPLDAGTASAEGIFTVVLDAEQISSILIRRRVVVNWGEPPCKALFPINIANESKPGLPAVLGQNPTEQDLLAYFHGRIDEEDLMSILLERGRQQSAGQIVELAPPGRELQNYVVREFLEGLYGMEEVLRESAASQRVFEQAMLGEFSPVSLANETLKAFVNHRRTATATAFQFVELLRLIENLSHRNSTVVKKQPPDWFNETRERSLTNLFSMVRTAAARSDFYHACSVEPFRKLVTGLLSKNSTHRFWTSIEAVKEPV